MLAEEYGGDEERPRQGGDQGDRVNGTSRCEIRSPAHQRTPDDKRRELTESASLEAKWWIGVTPRKDEPSDRKGAE